MKLSAPTKPVWIIAAICGFLGIAGHFISIPVVSPNHFYILAVGFVLMTVGTVLKGF